ncbi:lantibiotic dehydratase [Actinomadura gamaensis]|uniref:Lantibiotic dehydratase n=1 Tax=Actinomadura gamaensis TaxID=1763541 RepID=A0ABV9TNQ1_9ACTN
MSPAPDGGHRPVAATIEVFPDAVLRCAALPAQALAPFHAPAPAAAARLVTAARNEIVARRERLGDLLYAAVPEVADRRVRRLLLDVRRQIHRHTRRLDRLDELLGYPAGVRPELAEALAGEQRSRLRLEGLVASFEAEHAAVMRRERVALRQAGSCEHFRKALLLASPGLSASWEAELRRFATEGDGTPGTAQKKRSAARTERMERGVFAYLVRAATRPTPHGLWAGVVPVGMDETASASARPGGITLRAAEPRHAVSPDLTVFRAILDAIVRDPKYRWETPVRLAPTVRAFPDGWRVWRPAVSDEGWVPLRTDQAAERLLKAYGDRRARPLRSVISEPAGYEAAHRLLLQNVLRSDLRISPSDADPWAALAEAGDRLLDPDRKLWNDAVEGLRAACSDLSERLEVMGVDELRKRLTAIAAEVRAFAGRAGVKVGLPRWPVRVDYRPGLAASWTAEFREAVRRAVAETLAYYEADKGPELLRRSSMRLLLGEAETSSAVPVDHLVRHAGTPYRLMNGMGPVGRPDAARAVEELRSHRDETALRWCERLHSASPYRIPEADLRSEPTAGPGGAVVVAVCGRGGLRVEWGRPQPLALAARFEPLLGEPGAASPLAAAVRDWYASWPSRTARAMEITGADAPGLNVASRPPVTPRRLDSAGADRTVVRVDRERLLPWLADPAWGDALVPVYNSSAAIGGRDPRGFVLHRLALGHGWEFLCRRLLPRPAPGGRVPRVELPSSAVLSPARWCLGEQAVAEMLAPAEPSRYLAWRALADGLGLPETVWASVEDDPEAPPLYLITTSPLAVAALLHRLEERPRPVELFEVHGTERSWAECGDTGRRYSCELAVTWHDSGYWEKVRKP